mmetsp:Transcript_35137/g.91939  ORF Transcript_35137/g.91939 Transcript_35137/m.91939 type:complete len:200 (-) Transcript_35137:182-781(-)
MVVAVQLHNLLRLHKVGHGAAPIDSAAIEACSRPLRRPARDQRDLHRVTVDLHAPRHFHKPRHHRQQILAQLGISGQPRQKVAVPTEAAVHPFVQRLAVKGLARGVQPLQSVRQIVRVGEIHLGLSGHRLHHLDVGIFDSELRPREVPAVSCKGYHLNLGELPHCVLVDSADINPVGDGHRIRPRNQGQKTKEPVDRLP